MKKEEKILFWLERIQKFRSSGQTCRAWCLEQQIPVSTMSYWIHKLNNTSSLHPQEENLVFAKMPSEQELRRKYTLSMHASPVHIFISDSIRIEIMQECPPELLATIIKGLGYHA